MEDEVRLCLGGGLATTEVPPSWSPCVEDGGDQLRPPAMLSHTATVSRYKVTPQLPQSLLVAPIFSLRWRGHGRVSTRCCVSRSCKFYPAAGGGML